jgi:threonine/homoserine/homoserine lactone efflux protein
MYLRYRSSGCYPRSMDAPDALGAGLLAGMAIAMQFGAVSALLVEAAVCAGPRAGAAAGLGVASVDMAYAAGAVVAGSATRAVLAAHQVELKAVAATILALVGARGLWALMSGSSCARRAHAQDVDDLVRTFGSASAQYVRFVALTVVNPLTIVYFASVAASLSLGGLAARVAFVAGAGAASAVWHLLLSLGAGRAGQRFTPRIQRAVLIAGRLAVVGMAVRLAVAV